MAVAQAAEFAVDTVSDGAAQAAPGHLLRWHRQYGSSRDQGTVVEYHLTIGY